MGLLEETGKVLSSVVDALKSTPVVLSLLLMNLGLLVFLFWYSANLLEHRIQTTVLVADLIKETNKMLSTCVSDAVIRELIETVRHGRDRQ